MGTHRVGSRGRPRDGVESQVAVCIGWPSAWRGLAAGVAALLLGAASVGRSEERFAIVDVRVFDGTELSAARTVWVEGGVIQAVEPEASLPVGTRVFDGSGKTLLPGWIDAHGHATSRRDLEQALAFGVTTQLDMFTREELAATLRREQEHGAARDRADLFSAGTLATARGGHGTEFGLEIDTVASAGQAGAFVAERIAHGADYIKIVVEDGSAYGHSLPALEVETVRALADAARAAGKLSVAHVSTRAGARLAIDAGVDGLAHVWVDGLPEAELVDDLARRRMFVVSTLAVAGGLAHVSLVDEVLASPRTQSLVSSEEQLNLRRVLLGGRAATADARWAAGSLRELQRHGVAILAGTDSPMPGTARGLSLILELELLVAAGLSPIDALRAATSAPADRFALRDRGRIAPGLRADLILVRGDPTLDIRALRDVLAVWKQGQLLDRDAVRAAVAAEDLQRVADRSPRIGEFESGRLAGNAGERRSAGWQATTDALLGGGSSVELQVVSPGAQGSRHALRVRGQVTRGFAVPWSGAIYHPARVPMTPVDLSAYEGFRFELRGDGQPFRVLLFTEGTGSRPHARSLVSAREWRSYRVRWRDFQAPGADQVRAIAIVGGPALGSFELEIDAVELF